MKKNILLAISILLMLQGCVPLVVGGAATGAAVANDRRTTGTVIDDKTLQFNVINQILRDKHLANNSHTNVAVYNGLVLLTGEAANQKIRSDIEMRARSIAGVKRVSNHIIIGPRSTLANRTYDSAQTAKVKSAMLNVNIQGFNPNRVKVVTEHGVTFLLGIVTEKEANAIANVARRVSGVSKVVTLFEIDNNLNL